jgi:hypothetical protein
VVERRDSDSHPDAGVVVRDVEVLASAGDGPADGGDAADETVVCSWTVAILMGKRDP